MEGVPIWSRALSLYWRAYYRKCAQRTEQLRCNISWFSRRRACPIGGARARRPIRAEILSRSIHKPPPIRLLEGVETPVRDKGPEDIDFVVVRENSEDLYIGVGGRTKRGRVHHDDEVIRNLYSVKFGLDIDSDSDEIAYQVGLISAEGTKRVMQYAFNLATRRERHVSSVDKMN